MLWYESGDLSPVREVPPEKVICFDVETTGLDPRYDEVLQLAAVCGDGAVMFNDTFGIERRRQWRRALRVHGISPEMVAGRPSLRVRAGELSSLFQKADLLVGYNLPFDFAFLRAAGVGLPNVLRFDVMREFAPVLHRKASFRKSCSWVKLEVCARYYGLAFQAHDALEDARVTLSCFWSMLDDDSGQRCDMDHLPNGEVVREHGNAHTLSMDAPIRGGR